MPAIHEQKDGVQVMAYRIFKYAIYCFLAYNVWLFLLDDLSSSAQLFSDGVSWRNIMEAFSATIDTIAWVVLLLLFELETAVIPDEKLQGPLYWVMINLRGICYLFIFVAFYGYITKYGIVTNLLPFTVADICSLVGTDFTYAQTLDEYMPLTPDVCNSMQGANLQQIVGTQIIGTQEQFALVYSLAVTDIVNAADWLVIVAVLEGEVWLQINGRLNDRLLHANKYLKGFLYTILFACATYWGIDGGFLEFWDAILWLVAFIFIEMNIFEWQAETASEGH